MDIASSMAFSDVHTLFHNISDWHQSMLCDLLMYFFFYKTKDSNQHEIPSGCILNQSWDLGTLIKMSRAVSLLIPSSHLATSLALFSCCFHWFVQQLLSQLHLYKFLAMSSLVWLSFLTVIWPLVLTRW